MLNELMASNSHTVADEQGDYDDWIEVANAGASPIDLTGLGLVDHMDGSEEFAFPDTVLGPGEYIVVWADDEPDEGDLHAPFKLDADGEDVYLLDGSVIVDQVTFPAMGADQSFGRWPDGTGGWQLLAQATPGAENQNTEEPEVIVLFINEFMALNETLIQDEAGQYEDWVEIYNPGPDDVEMGGLYLTDDLTQTTHWTFPDTTLSAAGFLLVWCDNDPEDGPLHTNFRLSGDGEEIGLFGRLAAGNPEIDSYVFGPQTADISEGRLTDGGLSWVFFNAPTPGHSNQSSAVEPADPDETRLGWEVSLRPMPFGGETLAVHLRQGDGSLRQACLYDLQGRQVRDLLETLSGTCEELRLLWDGADNAGQPVGEGVYFLRVSGDASEIRRRVVVMR